MEVPLQRNKSTNSNIDMYSFNPCFNGSSSSTFSLVCVSGDNQLVSILVLMEVPLQLHISYHSTNILPVSILVLMEVPLQHYQEKLKCHYLKNVSILVLMEVPLQLEKQIQDEYKQVWFQSLF